MMKLPTNDELTMDDQIMNSSKLSLICNLDNDSYTAKTIVVLVISNKDFRTSTNY